MYEVGLAGRFEAAHRLQGGFGPASRLHGHTYRVEVTVRGELLNGAGMLLDVGMLRSALAGAIEPLNYCDLDEVEGLKGSNTTAEAVARHVFDRMSGALLSCEGMSMTVRIWESPDVFAGFTGPLNQSTSRGE